MKAVCLYQLYHLQTDCLWPLASPAVLEEPVGKQPVHTSCEIQSFVRGVDLHVHAYQDYCKTD